MIRSGAEEYLGLEEIQVLCALAGMGAAGRRKTADNDWVSSKKPKQVYLLQLVRSGLHKEIKLYEKTAKQNKMNSRPTICEGQIYD